MKLPLCTLLSFGLVTAAFGSPFTPRPPLEENLNVTTTMWRFASSLSKDANGVIEFCYAEEGSPERILGRLDVQPFRSSETKMPDLRILFTRTEVEGKKKVILLVGYAGRPGTFVVDVPGLTAHQLEISGTPQANPSGEITLLGFADGPVSVKDDGMGMLEGLRGRLFFRYVERG